MKFNNIYTTLFFSSLFFAACSTKEAENRTEFLSQYDKERIKLIGNAYLNSDKIYLTLELEGNSERIRLNTGDYYEIEHGNFLNKSQNSSFSFTHKPDEPISVKLYFEELGLAQHFIIPPFDNLSNLRLLIDNKSFATVTFQNISNNPTEIQLSLKCYDTQDSTSDNIRDFKIFDTQSDKIENIDFSPIIKKVKDRMIAPNCNITAEVEKVSEAIDKSRIIGKSTLTLKNSTKDSLIFIPQ